MATRLSGSTVSYLDDGSIIIGSRLFIRAPPASDGLSILICMTVLFVFIRLTVLFVTVLFVTVYLYYGLLFVNRNTVFMPWLHLPD